MTPTPQNAAFTRTDVLVVASVVGLLVAIVLPALANDRTRSSRVICANNLRQISAAQQLWGNDHSDLPPVMVPVAQGGTRLHPLAANAWLHFAILSNELVSARVLFCPSDTGPLADDFTGVPGHGYLHANNRNNATSYFVGYSSAFSDPQSAIIGGDRNVGIDGSAACSLFGYASSIDVRFGSGRWSTNLHQLNGNVMIRDGSVEMLDSAGLLSRLASQADDVSVKHLAVPR